MTKKIGIITLMSMPLIFISQAPLDIQNFDPDAFDEGGYKEINATFQHVFPGTFKKESNSFSYLWNPGTGQTETRRFNSEFIQQSQFDNWFNQNSLKTSWYQNSHNNQCYSFKSCNNWNFSIASNWYWENYVKNNNFSIRGVRNLNFLKNVDLKIQINNKITFEISKFLNQKAIEKFEKILKEPTNSNLKIWDINYKINVLNSENYFFDFSATLTLKYSYYHVGFRPDANLKNFLESSKFAFNNQVVPKNILNINKRLDIPLNQVVSLEEQIKKSAEVIDEKLTNFSNQWNGRSYNSRIEYMVLDNKNLAFVIKFDHPQNRQRYTYVLNPKVKIVFPSTVYELSQELEKRLILTPNKVYKEDNHYELVDDEPKLVEEPQHPIRKNSYGFKYGGKWEFHNNVDVSFFASKQENEILYINEQPVDVLDQSFHFNLEDLRLSQKESFKNTNEYKIEVKQFDKNSNQEENEKLLAIYQIDVIIKVANSVLDIKWFAWNPDKNIEQKKLITPFLTDENGDFLIDSLGNKIENPDFDPLLDPKTGTKKQIVWVSIGSNLDNLPSNTFFNQLPSKIKEFQNHQETNFGFIAEASVSGKGAILQVNNAIENLETSNFYYSINENNKTNLELAMFNNKIATPIKVSQNENNYFSTSGIWLFTSQFPKGTTSYKIVAIGQEDNKQLFTNVFQNQVITPFWESEAGAKLKKYLVNRKLNPKTIEQLSYEKILIYWKSFINQELFKTFYRTTPNKLEQKWNISEIASDFISLNDNNEPAISEKNAKKLLSLLLQDNSNLSNLELNLTRFSKNNDGTYDLKLDITTLNPKDKFKNLVDIDSITIRNFKPNNLKNEDKIEIEISQLEDKIQTNQTTEEVYKLLKNIPNWDKLDVNFEKEGDIVMAEFVVKSDYQNQFYISKNKLFWKDINDKIDDSNFTNIFENLDLKQINLTGIDNLEQAKEFVLKMINQNWKNNNWIYGVNWHILDFENILLKAINNIEKFDKIPHQIFLLQLRVLDNLNNQIYGSTNIELVNIVGNLNVSKVSDLSSINLDNITISTKNNPNFEIELKNKISNELLKNNLDSTNFIHLANLDEVINNFKNNPGLKSQSLKIEPLTFQLSGNNKIKIINESAESSKITKQKSAFLNKKTYYWLIPVVLFSTIGIGFFIFWLYNKFMVKFKK